MVSDLLNVASDFGVACACCVHLIIKLGQSIEEVQHQWGEE